MSTAVGVVNCLSQILYCFGGDIHVHCSYTRVHIIMAIDLTTCSLTVPHINGHTYMHAVYKSRGYK